MQEPETDAAARERCGSEGEVQEQGSDVGARVMLEQENKGARGDGGERGRCGSKRAMWEQESDVGAKER